METEKRLLLPFKNIADLKRSYDKIIAVIELNRKNEIEILEANNIAYVLLEHGVSIDLGSVPCETDLLKTLNRNNDLLDKVYEELGVILPSLRTTTYEVLSCGTGSGGDIISSVKRTSDGEVFTIGDGISFYEMNKMDFVSLAIKEFIVYQNDKEIVFIIFDNHGITLKLSDNIHKYIN